MANTTLLSDYITREDLAKELNLTTRTLDKWAWQRRGPEKVKVGKRCYYQRSAVARWIEEQRSTREAA